MKEQFTRRLETVADLAYLAGAKRFHSGDSRADVTWFIRLAEEFETLRRVDADGNETYRGKEYMAAIEEFAFEKLNLKHDHTCPVCSANVHGRVNAALTCLNRVFFTKAEIELRDLLNLTQPA